MRCDPPLSPFSSPFLWCVRYQLSLKRGLTSLRFQPSPYEGKLIFLAAEGVLPFLTPSRFGTNPSSDVVTHMDYIPSV